jgi:hypothetical protein
VSSALPVVSARPHAAPALQPRPRSAAKEVARLFTTKADRDLTTTLDNVSHFNELTRELFTEGKTLAQEYLDCAERRSEFIRQIHVVVHSSSNSELDDGKRKLLAQIATRLPDLTRLDAENVRSNYVRLEIAHKESIVFETQINKVLYNKTTLNFVLGSEGAGGLFNDARTVERDAQAAANVAQGCHRAIEEAVNELRASGLAQRLERAQVQAKDIMQQPSLPQHEGGPSITQHEGSPPITHPKRRDDKRAKPAAAVKPSGGEVYTEEEIAQRRRNDELATQFAPRHPVIAAFRRTWGRALRKFGINSIPAKKANKGGPENSDSKISGRVASQSRSEGRTQEQTHDQENKTESRMTFQGESGLSSVTRG